MEPKRFWVDTHCHLNLDAFEEDLDQVLFNARQAGVERVLIPGIDLGTSERAKALAAKETGLTFACGVHPNTDAVVDDETLRALEGLARDPRCAAVGEIGLDNYWNDCPPERQRENLLRQLDLAERLQLPIILHCRDAFADLFPIVQQWIRRAPGNRGVFHAFDGSAEEARRITDAGFFVGLGGAITFKNKPLRREMARTVPLEKVVLETDAHIEDENIKNIKVINKKWQDVQDFDSEFDAVIASYSLNMKDISEIILKMNKASKKHCYIFWFSGITSWENEQKDIFKILGKDYTPKLNKANIIYEILYQMNLCPDIKILRDTNFNRNYNDIEDVVKFLKYRYKIESDLYDAELKKYVENSYPETEKGYAYVDTTKYTEIHWIKE